MGKPRQTYLIGVPGLPLVKIGSSINPAKRFAALSAGQPWKFQMLHVWRDDIERRLHLINRHCRWNGEWFWADDLELDRWEDDHVRYNIHRCVKDAATHNRLLLQHIQGSFHD